MSTRSHGPPAVSSSSTDSEIERAGTMSAAMPWRRSSATVPGPIAATVVPASTRASATPAKNRSTAFTEVKTTRS